MKKSISRTALFLIVVTLILLTSCGKTSPIKDCKYITVGEIQLLIPKDAEKQDVAGTDYDAMYVGEEYGVMIMHTPTEDFAGKASEYLYNFATAYELQGDINANPPEDIFATMEFSVRDGSGLVGYITVNKTEENIWLVQYLGDTEENDQTDFISLFKEWADNTKIK